MEQCTAERKAMDIVELVEGGRSKAERLVSAPAASNKSDRKHRNRIPGASNETQFAIPLFLSAIRQH